MPAMRPKAVELPRETGAWEVPPAPGRRAGPPRGLPRGVPEPGPRGCAAVLPGGRPGTVFARCFHCALLPGERAPGPARRPVVATGLALRAEGEQPWPMNPVGCTVGRTASRRGRAAPCSRCCLCSCTTRPTGVGDPRRRLPDLRPCVVPSGPRNGPGRSPLQELAQGCLGLPWAALGGAPGGARGLVPGSRQGFRAPRPLHRGRGPAPGRHLTSRRQRPSPLPWPQARRRPVGVCRARPATCPALP